MKSTIAKAVIGTIGVSGLVVGGYYGIQATKPEVNSKEVGKNAISEKLIDNKYEILSNDEKNKQHWDAILISYKSAPQDLKFSSLKGDEEDALNKLQNSCQELLKPSTTSDTQSSDNYKKAEKWCVEPISIIEILKKRGINAFNLDDNDKTTNQKDWESKIKKHKAEGVQTKKITELTLSEGAEANTEDITKIKAQCTTISNKKNHEDKYDESLKKFEDWCTSKQ